LVPQLPQLLKSVIRSTHAPLQFIIPLGHWQTPPEQVMPPVHRCPQAPQLFESDCRFTHDPLQL
jgi:hypothetical protein